MLAHIGMLPTSAPPPTTSRTPSTLFGSLLFSYFPTHRFANAAVPLGRSSQPFPRRTFAFPTIYQRSARFTLGISLPLCSFLTLCRLPCALSTTETSVQWTRLTQKLHAYVCSTGGSVKSPRAEGLFCRNAEQSAAAHFALGYAEAEQFSHRASRHAAVMHYQFRFKYA